MTPFFKTSDLADSALDRFDILHATVVTFESRKRLGISNPEHFRRHHGIQCQIRNQAGRPGALASNLRTPFLGASFFVRGR